MSSQKGIACRKVSDFLVQMTGTNVLLDMYLKSSTPTRITLERQEIMIRDRGYVQPA